MSISTSQREPNSSYDREEGREFTFTEYLLGATHAFCLVFIFSLTLLIRKGGSARSFSEERSQNLNTVLPTCRDEVLSLTIGQNDLLTSGESHSQMSMNSLKL